MGILAGLVVWALSAPPAGSTEPVGFDSPRWQIEAAESRVEDYRGKNSLVLRGGLAILPDAEFTDGIIEYSCAFPRARAFVGVAWRIQDPANREEFYIRPHQSGNPDANQYTPVFNGLTAWQLYHGDGYGAAVDYTFDDWFPVKVVVSGDQAEVYVGDLETPVLFIDDLKRDVAAGGVGLSVANFGEARFADFRYQKIDRPALAGRVGRTRAAPPGTIGRWMVSSPFAESRVQHMELSPSVTEGLSWTTLDTEPTGLANLSRLSPLTREANTVFAQVTVESDSERATTLAVGYSDRLRLFLNGRLLYRGNNGYRSRDYRYLGTIGYFDAVTLPLEKGENHLLLAVSEDFGGWGVQAVLEDMEGLTVGRYSSPPIAATFESTLRLE